MKKLLLSGALLISATTIAQTTLFSDDFESGSGNWTLNVGGFGDNDWIVNNAYAGVWLTSTPQQPGAITNSPMSQYLHIYNQGTACAGLGECQAVFLAQSGGDKTAEMTNNISTTGMTNVQFDFYYLCMGQVGATYGAVEYSVDNGASWTNISGGLAGQPTWTNLVLSDPGLDNQAQLKFRFHWFESTTGADPSFAVDQVLITAGGSGPSTDISTSAMNINNWCEGTAQNLTVNFVANGTYNAANVYTAEISDAVGSFASPTSIGTLASSSNGNLSINATVPGSMPAGTGYRIRVNASDPATTGVDNGTDLTINPLPTVTLGTFSAVCDTDPMFTLTGGSPAGGTYSGTGVTANVFEPAAAGAGTHTITYSYTDGNGCSNTAQQDMVVNSCGGLEEQDMLSLLVYPNPAENFITLETTYDLSSIEIVDLSGRAIRTFDVNDEAHSVKGIPTGTYFIIATSNDLQSVKQIVIK